MTSTLLIAIHAKIPLAAAQASKAHRVFLARRMR